MLATVQVKRKFQITECWRDFVVQLRCIMHILITYVRLILYVMLNFAAKIEK